MFRRPGLVIFILSIFIAGISIFCSSFSFFVSRASGTNHFSVSRAYTHLQQIARKPHSMGTMENARVRSYMEARCRELGLVTEIQHSTGIINTEQAIVAGDVYNLIATLKGENNSKAVVISSHYDSQAHTPGAGDAGVSCAAMLETARILTSGKQLKNDVIFLFTDGEEEGLLGAEVFSRESPMAKLVGVVLNFDAAGNSGVSTMIETNPDNGWIVQEYAKSGAHHFSSSLHYEVYKHLPNSTDYSVFKKGGMAGLNNCFFGGSVNYHSMTDTPENVDLNSFQQQGDNMLLLVQHFGNLTIGNTKAPDVTYFNILGDWLIVYPGNYNLYFFILAIALFITFTATGLRSGKMPVRDFVSAILIYTLALVLLFFAAKFFFWNVLNFYPMYNRFYAGRSYNAHYYILAAVALGITVFTAVYQLELQKFSLASLLGGILFIWMVCLGFMYIVAPTAVFILCFPLIAAMLGSLLVFNRRSNGHKDGWAAGITYLVSLFPALLLLPPFIVNLFTVFGLEDGSSATVAVIGLLCGLSLPVLAPVLTGRRYLITKFALFFFFVAFITGHFHAGYTAKEPLQTNVRYQVNADEKKAYWISPFFATDQWNASFFKNSTSGNAIPGFDKSLISVAPLLDLPAPELIVQKDTVENGVRKLYLHCRSGRVTGNSLRFIADRNNSFGQIAVNGKQIDPGSAKKAFTQCIYYGLTPAGVDMVIGIKPKEPFGIYLIDRSFGLPAIAGYNITYPGEIIPGPGYNSGTTQLAKHVNF